ncbi:MAG TPA: hypothetical protein VJQ44_06910 [Gemmatimonadales bacterium]|nr:hypothetical protein [Gemmatimonadales bacterium]
MALAACDERQGSDKVAGPSFAPPVDPQACAPNSLNSQITAYFPGSTSGPIKTIKDSMIALPAGNARISKGIRILQEIGRLSRTQTVDTVAGSNLAQGIIKCIYNVKTFTPTFPSDPIYNFAPALSANKGGAFYTRGNGTGDTTSVHGAVNIFSTANIISGVRPASGDWTAALTGAPAGQVLMYGYRVSGYPFNTDPFVYEWATIPPAMQFNGGAVVALCDDVNPGDAMVHESNIGVLAYQAAADICDPDGGYSLVIKETGWGPRALAARLAHVMVDAMQPQVLQAATLGKSGTGGTVTTFKSKFQRKEVEKVSLSFAQAPPANMKVNQLYPVKVFVSADVNDPSNGINGVCVYLTGATNNGTNTGLTGTPSPAACDNTATGGLSAITQTVLVGNPAQPKAGYATFSVGVTKTGQLIFTASSIDAEGNTGIIERSGQTFFPATARTNVKP